MVTVHYDTLITVFSVCILVAICSKDTPRDSWPEFEPLYSLLNKLEALQDSQLRK